MPDDQNNSQDPQLNSNQNSEEQVIEQVFEQPVEQRSELPTEQPVLEPVATPGIIGSGPEPVLAVAPAPPKKPRKGLLIGLIVAAVLVVLGGGSALAYNFYYQNPDKVVGDALMNAITAKTIAADATFDLKGDDYTAKITVNGRTNEEVVGMAKVKIDYKSDSLNYAVDGEGIFAKNGDLFVKLNNVQELANTLTESSEGMLNLALFDTVIQKIDGTWVKISGNDLGNISEEYKDTQKCVADYSQKLNSDKALQKTVTDEFVALYSDNKFIAIAENLGSKEIKGVGSLGYKLDFDAAKAESFTSGLETTQFGKKLKECDSTINFKDVAESLTEEDGSTGTTTTELWVSRFGHEITEFKLTTTGGETDGTLVVQPTFNKNEAIETPKESITIEEITTDIQKAYEDYYTQMLAQ